MRDLYRRYSNHDFGGIGSDFGGGNTMTFHRDEVEVDECLIAIQIAEKRANQGGRAMAVMPDLSVVPLADVKTPPLEVVRAKPKRVRAVWQDGRISDGV